MERKRKGSLEWHYTPGHAGVPGNERVDEIASTIGMKKKPELYEGPLLKYDVPIYDLPEDYTPPKNLFTCEGYRYVSRIAVSYPEDCIYLFLTSTIPE